MILLSKYHCFCFASDLEQLNTHISFASITGIMGPDELMIIRSSTLSLISDLHNVDPFSLFEFANYQSQLRQGSLKKDLEYDSVFFLFLFVAFSF